jgi:beta-glucosidase
VTGGSSKVGSSSSTGSTSSTNSTSSTGGSSTTDAGTTAEGGTFDTGGATQSCDADAGTFAYPFRNYCLPVDVRVANLLSLLTDDEAVSMLNQSQPAVARLGIGAFSTYTEGIHGLGSAPGAANMTLLSTQFPQASGLGETWDPAQLETVGSVEGQEDRIYWKKYNGTQANLAVRAPVVDLSRDPRAGREEEHLGEDPYLVGALAKGYVRGLQGTDPHYLQTASTLKHFLAYDQEANRIGFNVVVDDRNLWEYYFVQWRDVLQNANAQSFMTSYNSVNGSPSVVSPFIESVVIGQWGFDGMVSTDDGALQNTYEATHTFSSAEAACAGVVQAGTPVIVGGDTTSMQEAFSSGLLTRAQVNAALAGNFRMRFRLGEFDPPDLVPYASVDGGATPWNSAASKALALTVTQKSIVLLKNSASTLPLDSTKLTSLAVIGPNANVVLQDWYGGKPPFAVTPLAGITAKVGTGVKVQYALDDTDGGAVNIATASNAAIVVVGNDPLCGTQTFGSCPIPQDSKEGVDRVDIGLIPAQLTLIQSVFAANPRTIVVLVSSFAQAISWVDENIPAILHITHASEELGDALADVLFGDYDPGGRTTVTWYQALTDIDAITDYNIRNGRTYMYFQGTPLYPFGYGLSYTTFAYSDLTLSSPTLPEGGQITVSVDVTNTGAVAGDEVVQLYVSYPTTAGVVRPIKQLQGFQRITLAPGAMQTVTMALTSAQLAYWNETTSAYTVQPGTVQVMVGGSSADVRAQTQLTAQ